MYMRNILKVENDCHGNVVIHFFTIELKMYIIVFNQVKYRGPVYLLEVKVFVSSLLLHSITEHIDFATPIQEPAAEPLCNANLAASMHTLDHLAGVANRAAIHYTGESQLREVG